MSLDRNSNCRSSSTADTDYFWFTVTDLDGNEIITKTDIDTIQNNNGSRFGDNIVRRNGQNVLFVWERQWYAYENRERGEIAYQIQGHNGQVIKDKTVFTPSLLPDSEDKSDYYWWRSAVTDNEGKVWISYSHCQTGQANEYFYVVIGTDGNIWKGPIQTTAMRFFEFCDMDGHIWAREGDQFIGLRSDDTQVISPRAVAFIPTQKVGSIAAIVSDDGYRLYDRWSPQLVGIDVPLETSPDSMELFDLNLWNNDLHPANIKIKKGETSVWNQSGQFTGHTTVDMIGVLNYGPNVLTITQDDFLGGQILITFPLTQPSNDTDSDGLPNSLENTTCTDSTDADTDNDSIMDGVEDANQNGIVDSGETDPCNIDTDGDGIQDGTEQGYTLNDIGPDTDTSIFQPDLDPTTTTKPLNDDTDGDGLLDGEEDINHNGKIDPGETDPNVSNTCTIQTTRTLPKFVYSPSECNPVSIDIDIIDEVTLPNGLIVKEYIPEEWDLYSVNPPIANEFDPKVGEMKWVFTGDDIADRTITYNISVPDGEQEGTSKPVTGQILYNDPITQVSHECTTGGDQELMIGCDCNPHDTNSNWLIGDFELLDVIDCWAGVDCLLYPAQCEGDFYLLDLIDLWVAGDYQCSPEGTTDTCFPWERVQ